MWLREDYKGMDEQVIYYPDLKLTMTNWRDLEQCQWFVSHHGERIIEVLTLMAVHEALEEL